MNEAEATLLICVGGVGGLLWLFWRTTDPKKDIMLNGELGEMVRRNINPTPEEREADERQAARMKAAERLEAARREQMVHEEIDKLAGVKPWATLAKTYAKSELGKLYDAAMKKVRDPEEEQAPPPPPPKPETPVERKFERMAERILRRDPPPVRSESERGLRGRQKRSGNGQTG